MKTRRLMLILALALPLAFQGAEEASVTPYPAARADRNYRIESSGAIEWEKMELSATVTLDLRSAGIQLPTGRTRAEEIVRHEYAALMRPYILAIPVDSSTVLGDLVDSGEFGFFGPEELAGEARRSAPAFSPDLVKLSADYRIDLSLLSTRLMRHRQPGEMRRVLSPVATAPYTGIIIIATGELPVHGRNTAAMVEPCLFPKVWDSAMNLVYERNLLDTQGRRSMVRYAGEESIFQNSPSGLSPELEEFSGPNPLRIIARGVFGRSPTDPVIDRDDALLILSGEENRRLLREGKVVIVLSREALRKDLRQGTH